MESSEQHKNRPITPPTINCESSVPRTCFYFLIGERKLAIAYPCAKFKQLKDPRVKAKRRPPTYSTGTSPRATNARKGSQSPD